MKSFGKSMGIVAVVVCLVLSTSGCGKKSMKSTASFDRKSMASGEMDLRPSPSQEGGFGSEGGSSSDVSSDLVTQYGHEVAEQLTETDLQHESFAGKFQGLSDDDVEHPGRRYAQERRKAEFQTTAWGLRDVYFEFESWRLTEKGKKQLLTNANWLKTHPHEQMTIEGHCDERGTRAYNYALGEKRATMARNFLVSLGISPSRLKVTSYGKDNPICRDLTKECFQTNRRAHMVVGIGLASNRPSSSHEVASAVRAYGD